jgi:hypothetical protein
MYSGTILERAPHVCLIFGRQFVLISCATRKRRQHQQHLSKASTAFIISINSIYHQHQHHDEQGELHYYSK